MPKLTKQQSKELVQLVRKTVVLRHTKNEALGYIQAELKLAAPITEQTYYRTKKQVTKDGANWYREMRGSQDAYVAEYRQRYDEMMHSQKELLDIVRAAKEAGEFEAAEKAQMDYHQITKDLLRFQDLLPWTVGSSTSSNSNDNFDKREGVRHTISEQQAEGIREVTAEETVF